MVDLCRFILMHSARGARASSEHINAMQPAMDSNRPMIGIYLGNRSEVLPISFDASFEGAMLSAIRSAALPPLGRCQKKLGRKPVGHLP